MQFPIVRLAEKALNTSYGIWRDILYYDGRHPSMALVHGAPSADAAVPLRIQSHCMAAFVFGSVDCDCRDQLQMAQSYIQERGFGLIIWLDQDGRGEGHLAWMLAANLAESEGIIESAAYARLGYAEDSRRYVTAAMILRDLGVTNVELLSNNSRKRDALAEHGVNVERVRPIVPPGGEAQLIQKGLVDPTAAQLTDATAPEASCG